MTINQVFPEDYDRQLSEKLARIETEFARFELPAIELFPSPPEAYRLRAEFKIWHEANHAHYAMYRPGHYKKPFIIESFPVGSEHIQALMPSLRQAINQSRNLRHKLFQVEFLTSLSGQALITLIYHRPLDEAWEEEARQLETRLGAHIIGRSRKQKRVLSRDYVVETMRVAGRDYHYQQVETGFTQPNGEVCQKMLNWAVDKSRGFGGDLLELYCGNGNFTLPLAQNFDKVLATELAKSSLASAEYNKALNQIDNLTLVRMSSEDFAQAMARVRPFRRLEHVDLDSYRFSSVFVDPPRAGLDPDTARLTQRFDHILYISCNPDTLKHNLDTITKTHRPTAFALFDQFPYSHHLECGVVLQRTETAR